MVSRTLPLRGAFARRRPHQPLTWLYCLAVWLGSPSTTYCDFQLRSVRTSCLATTFSAELSEILHTTVSSHLSAARRPDDIPRFGTCLARGTFASLALFSLRFMSVPGTWGLRKARLATTIATHVVACVARIVFVASSWPTGVGSHSMVAQQYGVALCAA